VVAVSAGIKRTLVEGTPLGDDDVTVIYNPVVTEEVLEMAREPVDREWFDTHDVVLGVGRLEPEKNFGGLLRAFERLHSDRPETRLVVLGEGSRSAALEHLATELEIADVVAFPGFVENPYKFMDAASVVALSSRREGLPTVLIEALACGTPVVSTACPHGPREILEDGKYGLLTPVEDDRALAKALAFALRSPDDRERLRDRASHFEPDAVARSYVDLIDMYGRSYPSP
jgi:glycosyltransferase involved in cell wall biosynthesis